jgi:pimeloyl-ACP methyl ester carboxylesterase
MFPAGRPDLRTKYLGLASGLTVRTVECGAESAPLILLLPGWGCSTFVFRENLASLGAAGFHAIAVDLKGHGLSDKPQSPTEYRLGPMRLHVSEILDALGAESVMLAGLSMGGALAAHAAADDPARVRAVVMISPVGFAGIPALTAIKLATPSVLIPLLPRLAGRSLVELLLWVVTGKLRQYTERDVDEYWAPTQFPEFSRALRHLLHEFDWHAPFVPLKVPCLLISGTRDRLAPPSGLDRYRRAMPDLRHVAVRDAGHVVNDEAASAANEAMIEFFRNSSAMKTS